MFSGRNDLPPHTMKLQQTQNLCVQKDICTKFKIKKIEVITVCSSHFYEDLQMKLVSCNFCSKLKKKRKKGGVRNKGYLIQNVWNVLL